MNVNPTSIFVVVLSTIAMALAIHLLLRRVEELKRIRYESIYAKNSLGYQTKKLEELRERQTLGETLLRKLSDVISSGVWTYSPQTYGLMKMVATQQSAKLNYSGVAIEITLEAKTTKEEADRMFGEAILRCFDQVVPEQGNLHILAIRFLEETINPTGFEPVVFIRIRKPLHKEDMGQWGFAGSIRAGCQARRFTIVVLSPPEGVGKFEEALVNLHQF